MVIKKTLQLINAIFFSLFIVLMGILPFRAIYLLADLVAFLLMRVFRYRLKVVKDNLRRSDLELSTSEEKKLIVKIYRNLADVLLEGIKSFSMSKRSVMKRHKVINPAVAEDYFRKKQSVVLVTGHIGNWEWGSLSAGLFTSFLIVGFYKPLSNKLINRILAKSRSKFNTILSPIRETSLSFEKYNPYTALFLMAADQSPRKMRFSHITHFMGRETAFLHGPEKHARNNNLPVIFCDIHRIKRGFYELELSTLCENPEELPQGEITERYVRKLEYTIKKTPEKWLWTHRRWKRAVKKRC